MSDAFDICDELAALIEPSPARRDSSLARPVEYEPERLYLWPRTERFVVDGTGDIDEARFSIRLAWCVDAGDEVAAGERERATSLALRQKKSAIAALLRANRTGATYEHAEISAVDYESLVTQSVRGFLLDLEGYVQQFEFEEAPG